ncbi:MAG TPA: hypothetical protein VGF17_12685 [Phytomonospora sp.]
MIDLDAILGEAADKPLRYKGREFTLPGELPGTVLAPFLRENLGLPQIIADIVAAAQTTSDADAESGWIDVLVKQIATNPNLPVEFIDAARDAFSELLEAGEPGQAAEFHALRPSVPAYIAIATHVTTDYGTGLADFFFSSGSSETGGKTSKPTSPASTPDSTPDSSGDTPPAAG